MARGAGAALATVALVAFAAPAAAATPQQVSKRIYEDLADNGRLDGHYTPAQIKNALHPPSLRGYELPQRTTAVVPSRSSQSAGSGGGRSVPFSGLDLALFGGVGAPLLLLGASLGRLARVRPDGEAA